MRVETLGRRAPQPSCGWFMKPLTMKDARPLCGMGKCTPAEHSKRGRAVGTRCTLRAYLGASVRGSASAERTPPARRVGQPRQRWAQRRKQRAPQRAGYLRVAQRLRAASRRAWFGNTASEMAAMRLASNASAKQRSSCAARAILVAGLRKTRQGGATRLRSLNGRRRALPAVRYSFGRRGGGSTAR